jgi:endonuclease G, mitochondrial
MRASRCLVSVPSVKPRFLCAGTAPTAVAVPTHFFKVVLAENEPGSKKPRYSVAAFAIPNRPIDPRTPVSSFVVPIDFLESVTGIEFFPHLLTADRRIALDAAASGVYYPCHNQFGHDAAW